MVSFTLRQCTYFRAVAEHGGIAQAARALNISQPSVAQALEKLEDVTGLVLFERHHARGLTLTFHGRNFLDHVIRLERQAQQVEREASALAAGAAGQIRLGVFWTLSPFYAPGLIRSFAKVAPGVIVRQREMALADLADALRNGSLDFAVTYDRGGDPEGLDFVELAAIRPKVVVAANHRCAGADSIDLADLADDPYVMLDGPGSRSYFENLLAELGINPRIAYVSSSLEGVRSAVAAGFGFTLLVMRPPSPITYDGGEVRTLRIDNDVRPLRIVLASRKSTHAGSVPKLFIDHAVRHFASRHATARKRKKG
jgi:DNA-binding transcriptional LysR family regulator